tara:strand:+ start:8476 stop:9729 length:1254 start_codon:yes stop_codon:yes gene_type:complete
MKKIIFFVTVILFTAGCAQKTLSKKEEGQITYFSTIEFVETPLSYTKGSVPLEESIAMKRNHYRFSYDWQNRVKTIAFFNGNQPRNPNHTGNLFTLAHRIEFTYDKNEERVTFYNTKGKQVSVLGDSYTFVFSLNKLGFRETLSFLNEKGNSVENSWNIYKYEWEYFADGSVIEDRFNKKGDQVSIRLGFEFYRLRLFFNNLGHIALMQNIDKEGRLIENSSGASQDRITTNAQGNFLKWEVLDNKHQLEKGNGPNVAVGNQEFNEFGYEISLLHMDEERAPMYSAYGICRGKTKFDAYGNISERFFYDEQNKPSTHKTAKYHSLKMSWDVSGNYRTDLEYFDVEGKPKAHMTRGYHHVKYHYNTQKELVKITYHDIHKELVNRKDNGIAYIKYNYDQEGNRTSIQRFDTKNNELKN